MTIPIDPVRSAQAQFGVVLERLRKRLLDLSANNKLLNYRHPTGSSLRLVDEVPSQVFARLEGGGEMTFVPLPDPETASLFDLNDHPSSDSAPLITTRVGGEGTDEASTAIDPREIARAERRAATARKEALRMKIAERAGVNPTYELAASDRVVAPNHQDAKLQTLYFPGELEDHLRKLSNQANVFIEETGANRLHLMFGFVEWIDAASNTGFETKRLAPLVLLPVRIRRGPLNAQSGKYTYVIEKTGEDWSTNVTLQEKCRSDFGMSIPDVDTEANESLEHYFEQIERLLHTAKPKWTLKRYLSLGLVGFGKILMWRDLDPQNWPNGKSIFTSGALRSLLGATRTGAPDDVVAGVHSDEYPIDILDDGDGSSLPPVVVEADSSQHSAIIDAMRGVNLVLQGPPGTGKSQTITNLIAAAMQAGKKVLFVAEKRAALDVVHRRLVSSGLDDFCLALHSHTSAKKEFIADLAMCIDKRGGYRRPTHFDDVRNRLVDARTTLNDHASCMHQRFGEIGLTPFQIFSRAQRLTAQLGDDVLRSISDVKLPRVIHVTSGEIHRIRDLVDEFSGAHGGVCEEQPSLALHPWAGVENANLSFEEVNDLMDFARALAEPTRNLAKAAEELSTLFGGTGPVSAAGLRMLLSQTTSLDSLGVSATEELPHQILTSSEVPHVRAAVDAVESARTHWKSIEGVWRIPGTLRRDEGTATEQKLLAARGRFGPDFSVREARDEVGEMDNHLRRLEAAGKVLNRIAEALSIPYERLTVAAVPVLVSVVTLAAGLRENHPVAFDLRSDATSDREAVLALEEAASLAQELRKVDSALAVRYQPSFRPSTSALREMAAVFATAPRFLPALLSSGYRSAKTAFRAMAGGLLFDRQVMLRDTRALLTNLENTTSFAENPIIAQVFGTRAAGIASPFEDAMAACEFYRKLGVLSSSLGDEGRRLAAHLWQAPTAAWVEALDRVAVHQDLWTEAVEFNEIVDAARTRRSIDVSNWRDWSIMGLRDRWMEHRSRASDFVAVADLADVGDSANVAYVLSQLHRVNAAWRADDELAAQAGLLSRLGLSVAGSNTDVAPLQEALQYIKRVRALDLPLVAETWLLGPDSRQRLIILQQVGARLQPVVWEFERAATEFQAAAHLNEAVWFAALSPNQFLSDSSTTLLTANTMLVLARLEMGMASDRALHPWAVYQRSRSLGKAHGLGDIISLVENGQLTRANAADAYEAVVFRSLAEQVFSAVRSLDHFDSGRHGEIRSRFAKLDKEMLNLTQARIAHSLGQIPAVNGIPGPRVADMSDEYLIRHQANLRQRHLAIRQLFRRAGGAIQNLKRCFLMGPQAVAQYLPAGLFEFDLVVMDEASQMRPEDALGAIARSKQAVIVGDPMQLGPTRFFDKADTADYDDVEVESEDSDDEENEVDTPAPVTGATVLERSESILTAAATCFDMRMLRWHYRSRHPKLIAFSNKEFYGDRLVVFPTPGDNDEDDGVFLRRIDGLYGARRNVQEAQAIVSAIRAHARDFPHRSLLVATMNAEQADAVDGLLERAEKEDEVLAAFLERMRITEEPFTIKNLENVQGDERDVIFVSVTFGRNAEGRLLQQFGPILQAGGERRLNVLFTRAKHRLEVFCSFDPDELRVSPTSPRGLRVLRDYLRFARDEAWWAAGAETGREPDSDFEVAIATALRGHGYEVRPQVGVAGYFLDMAVVDPDMPSRYILAVEADGATYHSAKSARDRDRLRQTLLEGLGWTFHRVWSTDYFRDPKGQINRIVERLQSLRQSNARIRAEQS